MWAGREHVPCTGARGWHCGTRNSSQVLWTGVDSPRRTWPTPSGRREPVLFTATAAPPRWLPRVTTSSMAPGTRRRGVAADSEGTAGPGECRCSQARRMARRPRSPTSCGRPASRDSARRHSAAPPGIVHAGSGGRDRATVRTAGPGASWLSPMYAKVTATMALSNDLQVRHRPGKGPEKGADRRRRASRPAWKRQVEGRWDSDRPATLILGGPSAQRATGPTRPGIVRRAVRQLPGLSPSR